MDQVVAASYHEAGHVIALRQVRCRVLSVCVNGDGSGETMPNELPDKDEDKVLVALSGIQAESHCTHTDTEIDDISQTYASASGDRCLIEKESGRAWLSHTSLWHQTQYNRAQRFVEEHKEQIQTLAEAILQKPAFPKCLSTTEIDAVVKR